nr:P-loop NTPase [Corallococcus exercitus]
MRCYSFHSVKGGVGKSTLSVVTALKLARKPGAQVTLIDMDLTGTSLADVLPLEAPAWSHVEASERLNLLQKPDGFRSLEETRDAMEERDEAARKALEENPEGPESRMARGVPFLNDYLLFATPDWDAQQDVPVASLLWRVQGLAHESLRVIPSSALPSDLERGIPVIFDENHSGFLEGRLEYLLDSLVPDASGDEAVVVVDTPPTIPGLSRSVLSLALRLSRKEKQPLSEDGMMPERLRNAEVQWTAFLVSTMDRQDLRAAARWLSLVNEEEAHHIRFLINRARSGDEQQLKDLLSQALGYEPNPLINNPLWVKEERTWELFRTVGEPIIPEGPLPFLEVE